MPATGDNTRRFAMPVAAVWHVQPACADELCASRQMTNNGLTTFYEFETLPTDVIILDLNDLDDNTSARIVATCATGLAFVTGGVYNIASAIHSPVMLHTLRNGIAWTEEHPTHARCYGRVLFVTHIVLAYQ